MNDPQNPARDGAAQNSAPQNGSAQKIAIVGSGMCGMTTALALARKGHRVTVFERDARPPDGDADDAFFRWQRLGAAQFRHPHAFLGLMCNLIQDNYPDLMERLYEAGARRVDFVDMLPAELRDDYVPEPGDEKLWVLLCRRATLETVIRRYVETMPNVEIRNRCHVVGLISDSSSGVPAARGLRVRQRGGAAEDANDAAPEQTFSADVVVDASGRGSHFPRWLKDLGREVREEKDSAEIVYYTRHYRLKPGEQEPPRGENRGAGDFGFLKYGVFPGDNGHFAIILCVPVKETRLREALQDSALFDRICLSIPGLQPWLAGGRSEPTTDSFGIGDIQAVWRHFVADGEPLALNFFAVGDAAVRTNPLYGRGCSTGILHAHILADVLEQETDPRTRALEFDRRTEDGLRPIYAASLREDRSGIRRAEALMHGRLLDKPDSLKKWFGLAFGDALAAAARERLHVMRGLLRTFHLLEKPGDFLKDRRIRLTVLAYMLRGRERNAARRLQKGPSRDEMLNLVSQQS
jgi:2-polyprenyl-6-methoxyphenol hydroxylase-like FAD-dependent oxidoreductase